jgi:hypothetical protein
MNNERMAPWGVGRWVMGEPKKLSLSVEPMQPGEWRWEFRNYTTRELFTSGMSGTEREAFEDAVVSVATAFSLAMAEWRDRANAAVARAEASERRADLAEEEAEDVNQRRSIENEQARDFTRCVAQALSPGDTYVEIPAVDDLPDLIAEVRRTRERAEAAEAEAERLRGLLSAERDGYAAGVADGRKAGGGEERDLIVACLRDFEKNGPPGLLSGAAQHIEAGCHWPDPLKPVGWQG